MNILYNNLLLASRKKIIFNKYIDDSLENKIFCFLIHLSFLFNFNLNVDKKKLQVFFDYIFLRIETDLRELGHGDMSVNRKMKVLVGKFYSILVDFQNFVALKNVEKQNILNKYFSRVKNIKCLSNYFTLFFKRGYKDIDLKLLNDNTPA